jgi:hypothetical protein
MSAFPFPTTAFASFIRPITKAPAWLGPARFEDPYGQLGLKWGLSVGGLPITEQPPEPRGNGQNLGQAFNFRLLTVHDDIIASTAPNRVDGYLGFFGGTGTFTGWSVAGNVVPVGAFQSNTPLSNQAGTDLATARAAILALPAGTDESGVNMGTLTLGAGTYDWSAGAVWTGALTLAGGPTSVYYFRVTTTLAISAGASLVLGNVLPENVFFVVGTSMTMTGAGSSLGVAGSFLVGTSATLGASCTVHGRILCTNGNITLAAGAKVIR